jgi:hypothetical protein
MARIKRQDAISQRERWEEKEERIRQERIRISEKAKEEIEKGKQGVLFKWL